MYSPCMSPSVTKKLSSVARIFHALSDETRVQIIEQLKDGEQCVCDMTDAFKTGQSRLSFHLRVLKDAGLVLDRPEGRWVYYSLNQEAADDLQDIVNWFKTPSMRSAKKGCCP